MGSDPVMTGGPISAVLLLYLLTLLLNIVCVALKRRSALISLFSLFTCVLLMGGNAFNDDYLAYAWAYEHPSEMDMEAGYRWLAEQFHHVGHSYSSFVFFWFLASLILMYILVRRHTKNTHLFFSLYMTTMLFVDTVQLRQFMCYIVFTYALGYLAQGKRLRFCLMTAVACLFHITTVVFLPLALVDVRSEDWRRRVCRMANMILLLCTLVFANGNRIGPLRDVLLRFVDPKKAAYFMTATHLGFLKYFLFWAVSVWSIWIVRDILENWSCDSEARSFADAVFVCAVYVSFSLPFIMLNNNFSRYLKFPLIGAYICIAASMSALSDAEDLSGPVSIRLPGEIWGNRSVYSAAILFFIAAYQVLIQIQSQIPYVFAYNSIISDGGSQIMKNVIELMFHGG